MKSLFAASASCCELPRQELESELAGAPSSWSIQSNTVQSATPFSSSNHHSVVLLQLGTRMSRDTRSCQSGSPVSISIDASEKHGTSKTASRGQTARVARTGGEDWAVIGEVL